jgi:hypothetical protein
MYKILLPIPLLLLALFFLQDKKKEETFPKRKVAAIQTQNKKPYDQEAVDISRIPAAVNHPKRGKKIGLVAPKNGPVRRQSYPWPTESIRELQRGLKLIQDLYGVASEDYDPRYGNIFKVQDDMTYFLSAQRPVNVANVAYDQNKDKYYPISAVIKLENVDDALREDLLDMGLEEHYYQASLKIMFIQSSHEKVIALYEELLSKKIKANLEVIKGFNRPR